MEKPIKLQIYDISIINHGWLRLGINQLAYLGISNGGPFLYNPNEYVPSRKTKHLRNASSKSQGRLVAANTMTSDNGILLVGHWGSSGHIWATQNFKTPRKMVDWYTIGLMKIHSPARSVGCFPLGNPRIAAYDVLILQELIQSKVWNIQHWCILSFPHRFFHIWPKGMSKIHEGRRPTDFELATHQVFLIEHMQVGPVEPIFCKFQMLMIDSVSYLSVRYPLVL